MAKRIAEQKKFCPKCHKVTDRVARHQKRHPECDGKIAAAELAVAVPQE
jgi:ssDNA-binding Zn-finger/Zn-ribbon topoisomerase 1